MNELGNTPADKNYKPSGISRVEEATRRIHNRAILEAEKYSNSHGGSITEEVAYGRGFKAGFIEGYKQVEKDILSKFTKDHLQGLKWIEDAGIATQPVPYHKYCKDLYKVLKELLNDDIQGDTSI